MRGISRRCVNDHTRVFRVLHDARGHSTSPAAGTGRLALRLHAPWAHEPEVLREALELAWDTLLGQPVSWEKVRQLEKRVDAAQPDTEDFAIISSRPAMDEATTVSLVLKLLESDSVELVVEIAFLSRDTVDMYIQWIEPLGLSDTALEENILLHSLMQAERQR
jgi:uncharacterized protein YjaG (DUF416 family)